MSHIHVIGAGLAGLAAAVKLTKEGHAITLYEGAGHAGGRARSFRDETLGTLIDNGNHLVLSGNLSVLTYLKMIDATKTFDVASKAVFPFLDLQTGESWQVRPGRGKSPFWLFRKGRGIPGVKLSEYFSAFKLNNAAPGKTVTDTVGRTGKLYERFWDPLTLAALNTPTDQASALLLKAVLSETFFRGAKYCRPMVAKKGLSQSFVDPAIKYLKSKGAKVHFNNRLTEVVRQNGKIVALTFGKKTVPLVGNNKVVLALPPNITSSLIAEVAGPDAFHAIVNIHYKLSKKASKFGDVPFLGLLGGTAHWLFIRGNIASVTVSAADDLADKSSDEIAKLVWQDVAKAIQDEGAKVPPCRVIKEKRATFSQTPASLIKRPSQIGPVENLFLAGDWTQTYIPATIESAVRSGLFAAQFVMQSFEKKSNKKS